MKFDLRAPIGILFSLYGLLLVVYGFMTDGDAKMYERSLGMNINLRWGLVLLVFGLAMLAGAWFSKGKDQSGR